MKNIKCQKILKYFPGLPVFLLNFPYFSVFYGAGQPCKGQITLVLDSPGPPPTAVPTFMAAPDRKLYADAVSLMNASDKN